MQPPSSCGVLLNTHCLVYNLTELTRQYRSRKQRCLVEKQESAHVCTPAPTVWPTPCTPVLRRASVPVMKVCTDAPPSSIRLASLSEAVGAAWKVVLFEIEDHASHASMECSMQ